MIRSLIEPIQPENGESPVLRRNFSLEKLEQIYAASEMMWIDAYDVTDDEIKWLATTFALHPTVVADLRRVDRRPTLLSYPNYLFLSMFQPLANAVQIEPREIHCILGDNFFITVRGSETTKVAEAYDRVANNFSAWHGDIAYFLYLVTQHVVDAYYPLLDQVSLQLNSLEQDIFMGRPSADAREAVFRIMQRLIALRQMAAPQREVLSNSLGDVRLSKTGENRDLFRHLYERLMRVYEIIDSQHELSGNVIDLARNQDAARLGDTVGRLTILSMIFLPLTFLVGLFELNFVTTDPKLTIPVSGFTMLMGIVVMMMATLTGLVWYVRHKQWL